MGASTERTRTRAGGRSEQVRRAVGEATLALLAEGKLDFTMVDVAARAGVGRRTVYRWWPTQDDLLAEALSAHVRRVPTATDTGSWEHDLRALAYDLAEFASDPVEVAIASIMATRQHPAFNALVVSQWEPARNSWHELVRQATRRGEVRSEHDPTTVINALMSPMFLSPLTLGRSLSTQEIDSIVELLLSGTRAGPPTPTTPALPDSQNLC
ncbi:TetR/AcrR family transcriptional regulator [Rhodococcus chondri]|uniref:TetR/AcrR family transcriptional regulator n=1 Tax=Rhodococcus chondri TaxID=3065941 RepID=A0ABU7JPM4_9NOCA|nr:TetR/AcrR family transcriptional regulator [Rhodococcus sp. CC-R104]MEE2031981.1 TetR/AcrR family transcriptional regulator [Rhodococcus sp. CC-R104]